MALAPVAVISSASSNQTSQAKGSYRMSGYRLELDPDHGPAVTYQFFVYRNATFWPDSDKPGDAIGAVNIDGRLFYRDGR